jgi:hypothetical protein
MLYISPLCSFVAHSRYRNINFPLSSSKACRYRVIYVYLRADILCHDAKWWKVICIARRDAGTNTAVLAWRLELDIGIRFRR